MFSFDESLYEQLRTIASRMMAQERSGHTLGATALLHEAVLKIADRLHAGHLPPENLIPAAAQAMRRVLVDHARSRNRLKRGGGTPNSSFEDDSLERRPQQSPANGPYSDFDLEALQVALDELTSVDADAARIVDLRFFAGLEVDDAARIMGISPRSAARLWAFARAWLLTRLNTGR